MNHSSDFARRLNWAEYFLFVNLEFGQPLGFRLELEESSGGRSSSGECSASASRSSDDPSEDARKNGYSGGGLRIAKVRRKSQAYKSGLRENDLIIHVSGYAGSLAYDSVMEYFRDSRRIGHVTLVVIKGGRENEPGTSSTYPSLACIDDEHAGHPFGSPIMATTNICCVHGIQSRPPQPPIAAITSGRSEQTSAESEQRRPAPHSPPWFVQPLKAFVDWLGGSGERAAEPPVEPKQAAAIMYPPLSNGNAGPSDSARSKPDPIASSTPDPNPESAWINRAIRKYANMENMPIPGFMTKKQSSPQESETEPDYNDESSSRPARILKVVSQSSNNPLPNRMQQQSGPIKAVPVSLSEEIPRKIVPRNLSETKGATVNEDRRIPPPVPEKPAAPPIVQQKAPAIPSEHPAAPRETVFMASKRDRPPTVNPSPVFRHSSPISHRGPVAVSSSTPPSRPTIIVRPTFSGPPPMAPGKTQNPTMVHIHVKPPSLKKPIGDEEEESESSESTDSDEVKMGQKLKLAAIISVPRVVQHHGATTVHMHMKKHEMSMVPAATSDEDDGDDVHPLPAKSIVHEPLKPSRAVFNDTRPLPAANYAIIKSRESSLPATTGTHESMPRVGASVPPRIAEVHHESPAGPPPERAASVPAPPIDHRKQAPPTCPLKNSETWPPPVAVEEEEEEEPSYREHRQRPRSIIDDLPTIVIEEHTPELEPTPPPPDRIQSEHRPDQMEPEPSGAQFEVFNQSVPADQIDPPGDTLSIRIDQSVPPDQSTIDQPQSIDRTFFEPDGLITPGSNPDEIWFIPPFTPEIGTVEEATQLGTWILPEDSSPEALSPTSPITVGGAPFAEPPKLHEVEETSSPAKVPKLASEFPQLPWGPSTFPTDAPNPPSDHPSLPADRPMTPSPAIADIQRPPSVTAIRRQWPPPSNASGVEIVKDVIERSDTTEPDHSAPKEEPKIVAKATPHDTNFSDKMNACRSIVHELKASTENADTGQLSKAQRMFTKRKERSAKYVAAAQSNEKTTIDPSKVIKRVRNPLGDVHDLQQMKKEDRDIVTNLASAEKCQEISQALKSHAGSSKGVEMFERRRREAQDWVVDEPSTSRSGVVKEGVEPSQQLNVDVGHTARGTAADFGLDSSLQTGSSSLGPISWLPSPSPSPVPAPVAPLFLSSLSSLPPLDPLRPFRRELERIASPTPTVDWTGHERIFSPVPFSTRTRAPSVERVIFTPVTPVLNTRPFTPVILGVEPGAPPSASQTLPRGFSMRREDRERFQRSAAAEFDAPPDESGASNVDPLMSRSHHEQISRAMLPPKMHSFNTLPRSWKSYSDAYRQRSLDVKPD